MNNFNSAWPRESGRTELNSLSLAPGLKLSRAAALSTGAPLLGMP